MSLTIADDLQSELACPGAWQPSCSATHLGYDADDTVGRGVFRVPAGSYQFKLALNSGYASYGPGSENQGPGNRADAALISDGANDCPDVCGDGYCSASEDYQSCPEDCLCVPDCENYAVAWHDTRDGNDEIYFVTVGGCF